MIQPQELRIGNYVEYRIQDELDDRKEWWELSIIDSSDLQILESGIDEDYRAIPLTEEILLKFGLKKIDDNLWQYKNGYLIGFYTKRWFIGKYNFDDMVEMITSFYYAHQLQNLYFALTGEELTFKK